MPSKYIVKTFIENGYYHIYNRGVEKRDIFIDEQDCKIFSHYCKLYLSPVEELNNLNLPGLRIYRFIRQNLSKELDLLVFSLMPNHIHLVMKQTVSDGITKFMRRLLTSYVMYFNKKYNRVGVLFQDTYKAINIPNDSYLLYLSKYIHLNPFGVKSSIDFNNYSSYPYYLGQKHASWIKPYEILSYFNNSKSKGSKHISSYKSFIEDYLEDSSNTLSDLTLEESH